MPSTGSNKIEDFWRSRGTTRLTPLSGVTDNGGVVTATVAAGVVTLNYTAAKVLMDSLPFSIAAGSVATAALPNGRNEFNLYVVPDRKVKAVSALGAVGAANTLAMLVSPADKDYEYLNGLYISTGTAWVLRDTYATSQLDPNKPYVPNDSMVPGSADFKHLPFNEIQGANVSLTDERSILYHPNAGGPLNMPGMGPSYARFSTSFVLAKVIVTLTGGALAAPTDLVIKRPSEVDLL